MSILDKIEQRVTGQRRAEDWRAPEVKYAEHCGLTGNTRLDGFAEQAEHVLELRLAVTFWANPVQVNDCRRSAEQLLLRTLYADAHVALARIRHAANCGDRAQAVSWCNELTKLIEG
jgi:hypothetical protein